MKSFEHPNRCWYPTGRKTADNKPMWASREPTPEDRKDRGERALEYARRQHERAA